MNVVDFDDKYIVSASGDRTIKVFSNNSESSLFSNHQIFRFGPQAPASL